MGGVTANLRKYVSRGGYICTSRPVPRPPKIYLTRPPTAVLLRLHRLPLLHPLIYPGRGRQGRPLLNRLIYPGRGSRGCRSRRGCRGRRGRPLLHWHHLLHRHPQGRRQRAGLEVRLYPPCFKLREKQSFCGD